MRDKYERTRLPQAAFYAGNWILSEQKSGAKRQPVCRRTERMALGCNPDRIAWDPNGAVGADVCILAG